MNRARAFLLLAAIVAAHLILASWYAAITPYRTAGALSSRTKVSDVGAPDERQHVNYVAWLAAGKGFPVFNPNDPNLGETYQSHQPPAFYLLELGWSKLMGVQDFQSAEPGFKLRSLNVFIGGCAVVGVFFLTLWALSNELVALMAATFAGLLPMFAALAGAVSNDPLLICLCTWVLALLALGVRDGFSWKLAAGIAVLAGLAFLTKTTALALFAPMLVALLVPQKRRPSLAMAGAVLLIAILIAAPWWARNQRLYGDPFAMTAFKQAFKGSAQKEQIVSMIAASGDSSAELTYWKDWVGWWTARSFFGAFGYMDIWLNESPNHTAMARTPNALYRLLIVGFLVTFLGWVLSLSKPEWKPLWPMQAVNGAFILAILLSFFAFNMQYFQAQARYLLPALGPISVGVALGIATLMERRRVIGLCVLAAILVGVNVYALSLLPDEFAKRIELARQLPQ